MFVKWMKLFCGQHRATTRQAQNRKPSKQQQHKRAKPRLELLEMRLVPTSTWTGNINSNWQEPGNPHSANGKLELSCPDHPACRKMVIF